MPNSAYRREVAALASGLDREASYRITHGEAWRIARNRRRHECRRGTHEMSACATWLSQPKAISTQGSRQFRCADCLADVALRVFRDVRQQTDHCGREAFASDFAWIGERGGVECADYSLAALKGGVQVR